MKKIDKCKLYNGDCFKLLIACERIKNNKGTF